MQYKKSKALAGFASIATISVSFILAANAKEADDASATPFGVTSNPIFKVGDLNHFSSDPSIAKVLDSNGNSVLVAVSSHDMEVGVEAFNPDDICCHMDFAYLYATYGTVFGNPLMTTWYDHGPVIKPVLKNGMIDPMGKNFPWAKSYSQHLWAPDIQYIPAVTDPANPNNVLKQAQIWLYVPDIDPDGKTQRIGMAHVDVVNGLYDFGVDANGQPRTGFQTEANFFQVMPGSGGDPNCTDPPMCTKKVNPFAPGFALDPGVFYDDVQKKYFMVYVNNDYDHYNFNTYGTNLGIVEISCDSVPTNSNNCLKSGFYLGQIKFNGANNNAPLKNYSGLKTYMEGPDIFAMYTPGGNPREYYYLVFAASVDGINISKNNINSGTNTAYLGYAMCTPQEFAQSPATCWKFKGWIFRNHHSGASTHPSLIQFNNTNYVFSHRVIFPGADANNDADTFLSVSRQVIAKEFEIRSHPADASHPNGPYDDDGEIVGVTYPSDANREIESQYGTLDGKTRSITKGFINIQDDAINSGGNSMIKMSSLRNLSGNKLSNFQLYYYLNVEPGQNLHVDPVYSSNASFQLASPTIKHISLNTWAVVVDYSGMNPVDTFVNLPGVNTQFTLHYDSLTMPCGTFLQPAICGTFDKFNDFSQPDGDYPAFTTRVALFDGNNKTYNSNGQLTPNLGETPDTYESYKALRTLHRDKSNKFTYLTPSTANPNEGINNQYLKGDWDQQQWIFEPVTNFNGLSIADQDKPNAVRLKSRWTGYYLTCNNVNKNTIILDNYGTTTPDVVHPLFWIFDQALRWNWATQIWIKEDLGNGVVRYRSAWTPPSDQSAVKQLYLTLSTNNVDTGKQDTYALPLNSNLDTQKWTSESTTYKVLRTTHKDGSNQFTYLAASTMNNGDKVGNQYLQTGSDLQKWIIEPVTDFTGMPVLTNIEKNNAVRLRNKQTGYYMTTNNVNQAGYPQQLFLVFDQALSTNPNWATQVWIKENFGDGSFQLRSVWAQNPNAPVKLYLTLNNSKNNDTGTQDVYAQPLGSSWDTQRWMAD